MSTHGYYIHCRNGLVGSDGVSTPRDIDAIAVGIDATTPPRVLTIHFHGSLIPKPAALEISQTLMPCYAVSEHHSTVFYAWESGLLETLRDSLLELASEPVFNRLLSKLLEYTLGLLTGVDGARSFNGAQVDSELIEQALKHFSAHPHAASIPFHDVRPRATAAQIRAAAARIDCEELQADLENDQGVLLALAGLPDVPMSARSSTLRAATAPERRTPFALHASEVLSEQPGRRGLVSVFKTAWFLKDVIVGVLRRYADGRDHGLYATCIEELARAFKLAGSSANDWVKALHWHRLKQDCSDAFGPDADRHAGTALLQRIHDLWQRGGLERVTLIGHGLGALHVCEWLDAADAMLPAEMQFDVVLLGPAVTYARFDATLTCHGHRIRNFRMFALSDALERADPVWGDAGAATAGGDWRRFIYPSSLLYLASGLLESKPNDVGELVDEPDMPLLGMQRFFSDFHIYDAEAFPEVARVRAWLQQDAERTVWSVHDAGPGLSTCCKQHRQFDREHVTLTSLQHLITSGF